MKKNHRDFYLVLPKNIHAFYEKSRRNYQMLLFSNIR